MGAASPLAQPWPVAGSHLLSASIGLAIHALFGATWLGAGLAVGLTGWGLWRMEIQPVWKAYLLVCWFYLISNVFTLAKMLRDARRGSAAAHGTRCPARRRAASGPPCCTAASA